MHRIETAWAPVEGADYLYLYCLWVQGAPRGQGVGKALMESCHRRTRGRRAKAGVCMLGAEKQKAWLSDQRFAEKFGFQTVGHGRTNTACLPLRFDERPAPYFAAECQTAGPSKKNDLTVYYTDQCPFIAQRIEKLRAYCATHEIPAAFLHVETTEQAKNAAVPVQQLGGVLRRQVRYRQPARRRGRAEAVGTQLKNAVFMVFYEKKG